MKRHLLPIILAASLQGCFTGVESTPKITYSDVKKENIVVTEEQKYLADALPQPPAQWQPGKKFYITDPKASIVFTGASASLAGKDISFDSMYPVASLTGEEVTEIAFADPDGNRLYYRDNLPYADINKRQSLEIPFTIEESIVDIVKDEILGKTFYTTTPLWYTEDGAEAINGLRYIESTIVDVKPGNTAYPLRIVFAPKDSERRFSMYMTVGNQRTSTRNFHTLFAFDNPRKKYAHITDDVWAYIMNSRVKIGMTRDECRLALGAPQTIGQRPTTAGMVEYWSYSDGVYLLFEDGYLSYFRK